VLLRLLLLRPAPLRELPLREPLLLALLALREAASRLLLLRELLAASRALRTLRPVVAPLASTGWVLPSSGTTLLRRGS